MVANPCIPGLTLSQRYALSAVVTLARSDERMAVSDLAAAAKVPPAFLAKLLRELSRTGVVEGVKGHHGGFRLGRPASKIVVNDVLAPLVAEDSATVSPCAMGDRACDASEPCALHHRWALATAGVRMLVSTVTIADIASGLG